MKTKTVLSLAAALCLSAQALDLNTLASEAEPKNPSTEVQTEILEVKQENNEEETSVVPDAEDMTDPGDPAEPEAEQPEPEQPETEEPETEQPENPEQPETPDPEEPENPDPEEPETPEEPEQPETPDPEEPEVPSEPEAPAEPAPAPEITVPAVVPNVPVVSTWNVHATPIPGSWTAVGSFSQTIDARLKIKGLGNIHLLPNFNDEAAWAMSSSAYNTPELWGQCTWFAWGRFYEIYGFDPGFTGNGNQCVDQLVATHGDLFEKSRLPRAGAVFSSDYAHNHVGIVLAVDKKTGTILIQEGNLDSVSNPDWEVATKDWRTAIYTQEQMAAAYGNVVYANPKLNERNKALNHIAFIRQSKKLKEQDFGNLKKFKFSDYLGDWTGTRLNAHIGTVMGPSGKETYYNLPMSGVVDIMRRKGNTDEYWVRSDGCKMLGDYIMVAADLSVHPRGSLVATSLGMGIVCDTGEFALTNPYQIDIAVDW